MGKLLLLEEEAWTFESKGEVIKDLPWAQAKKRQGGPVDEEKKSYIIEWSMSPTNTPWTWKSQKEKGVGLPRRIDGKWCHEGTNFVIKQGKNEDFHRQSLGSVGG